MSPTSLNVALLGIDAFYGNPITKVTLVVATMASFFAVVLLVFESVRPFLAQSDVILILDQTHHAGRPLVAFLVVAVLATLFALAAHSWTQTECSPDCWVERGLVSAIVLGGFASLMAMLYCMRYTGQGDGGLESIV
jgi:uncharacterized membrane protein YidH (DUF202 family)